MTSQANMATASGSTIYRINLPMQSVARSLTDLSVIADKQLLFPHNRARDVAANPVQGDYTLQQALDKMLTGTGFSGGLTKKGVLTVSLMETSVPIGKTKGKDKMNTKRKLLAGVVGFFAGAQGLHAQDVSGEERGWLLDEVVVTADRRGEKNIQDVPISMEVIGGDAFDSESLEVLDVLTRLPGISFGAEAFAGASQVAVRGVASSGHFYSGGSTTGYYLDSVPFGFVRTALVPDANGYDLERVEALRGPQGTLYGVSALNGVVRILTKDANLEEFEVKARTSISTTDGGADSYRGDVALNVPLVPGKLAARLVASHTDLGGWIDKPNAIDGNVKNVNDAVSENVRLKVNAQPTEELSIEIMAWHTSTDYGAPDQSDDDGNTPTTQHESNLGEYDVFALAVEYDFSNFSIKSSTSHIDYTNHILVDFTPRGFAAVIENNLDAEVFSQEFNLYSTLDGSWQWSAGLFYRDAEDTLLQAFENGGAIFADNLDASESIAVFAEVTKSLLDGKLDLTGGLRYFEDEVSYQELSNSEGALPLINTETTFYVTSPRVVLAWHPQEDLTVYTSYAEGFRSGYDQTANVTRNHPQFPAAKDDNLTNYEIGAKGDLLDERLTFDLALYYSEWEGVQQNILVPFAGSENGITASVNLASASGPGVDLGVTIRPSENLQFTLGGNWNDLTVDSDVFSGVGENQLVLFPKGSRLNSSVERSLAFSFDYQFILGSSGLDGTLSGSASYDSAISRRAGSGLERSGDSLLRSRLGLTVSSPKHWTTTLYVDNLNNDDAVINPGTNEFLQQQLRPRTIGLQLEYEL